MKEEITTTRKGKSIDHYQEENNIKERKQGSRAEGLRTSRIAVVTIKHDNQGNKKPKSWLWERERRDPASNTGTALEAQ